MNNNDTENPPVPVATVAEPAPVPVPVAQIGEELKGNNNSSEEQSGCSKIKTYPICYSPCYYYYKLIICIYGVVSSVLTLLNYQKNCADDDPTMIVRGLFGALTILWAIQGLFHLGFIVHRFVTKEPPSDRLYSGNIESKLMWPLAVEAIVIMVVCVVGIVLHHALKNETEVCVDDDNQMRSRFIEYLILALLMTLRIGKANL